MIVVPQEPEAQISAEWLAFLDTAVARQDNRHAESIAQPQIEVSQSDAHFGDAAVESGSHARGGMPSFKSVSLAQASLGSGEVKHKFVAPALALASSRRGPGQQGGTAVGTRTW